MKKILIFIAVLIFASWGCETDPLIDPPDPGDEIAQVQDTGKSVQGVVLFEFKDIDGNVYHAMQIGTQIWSQENLRTTHYNDGTPIKCIQDVSQWTDLTTGAYCCYGNDASNSDQFGLLYNNYAVASTKLAPKGWHVATRNEWNTLLTEIKDITTLRNTEEWSEFSSITYKPCGFSALPNGYRDIPSGDIFGSCFNGLGRIASWWTSTQSTIIYLNKFHILQKVNQPDYLGAGIRLVKDPDNTSDADNSEEDPLSSELKDFDGNVYGTIQIGSLLWSQENLKTTHYNDGTPIPCIEGTSQWLEQKTGAYCHYNNEASNSDKYGLLYNYYAIASNKLAPKGWHVATFEDWNALLTEVCMDCQPFNPNRDIGPLVNAADWSEPFYATTRNDEMRVLVCTNSSRFTALPNGYRDISNYPNLHEFDCIGVQASWWTSTKGELGNNGIIMYLDGIFGVFPRGDIPANVGSGIRLVKNAN